MRLAVLPFLTLALALPALAVDGVLEINQACAVSAGCFVGDSGGFPVTISSPGSYRLTSNLITRAPGDGIDVTTEQVEIDLNGFTIGCDGGAAGGTCEPGTGPWTSSRLSGGGLLRRRVAYF